MNKQEDIVKFLIHQRNQIKHTTQTKRSRFTRGFSGTNALDIGLKPGYICPQVWNAIIEHLQNITVFRIFYLH